MALITKKAGASLLKNFNPISLTTGIYKVIIAKIIAERLKMLVNKLVNKDQITLIKERQIMDIALIVSECVISRLKVKSLV